MVVPPTRLITWRQLKVQLITIELHLPAILLFALKLAPLQQRPALPGRLRIWLITLWALARQPSSCTGWHGSAMGWPLDVTSQSWQPDRTPS